ncbi:hypothetical protein CWI42_091660 [Ordospora colligata]|uniref:Uncharacterized protein n=1 Tax=Ordospora colligata OC4 TaxID=1354746 RepID=A0A0B2UJX8_9MICR|nr:uncharacterized protein M896_091680 [Ordospora colligata OC4]KHN69240.1 hypothetical protein M896_091680 [Ordospora colligata OC4]TBU14518.1 hypothetical protein CWI40_091640 [Ordospora colligata]TBU14695.1 hypothetical protein CWI41_091670 [Ordospora colligata]TBU18080.1 hypothetical protein CWI42_091660 [Ordospora colligata]
MSKHKSRVAADKYFVTTESKSVDCHAMADMMHVIVTDSIAVEATSEVSEEDLGEEYSKLNKLFILSCMSVMESGESLMPLFTQYKSFIKLIKENEQMHSGEFEFSLSDCQLPVGSRTKNTKHQCSQSGMYKFLTNYFGVECPNTNINDEFVDSLEEFKRMERMSDFPFNEPVHHTKGSGMILSLSLSRMEDVGNHNRKVFETITKLRKEKNALTYVKNPMFFEESSDEEGYEGDTPMIREVVGCAHYESGKYKFLCDLVLRGVSSKSCNYINMRRGKRTIFRHLDGRQIRMTHSKGEDVVYMLVMKTMEIYKLVCRHPSIALKIYEHLKSAWID